MITNYDDLITMPGLAATRHRAIEKHNIYAGKTCIMDIKLSSMITISLASFATSVPDPGYLAKY
jgi:hypothetical protein